MEITAKTENSSVRDRLEKTLQTLSPALKRQGVARLSLFGSVLKGRERADSDVDLLMDLQPGVRISLLDRLVLRDMIADELGQPVDLVPRSALLDAVRERIESEAEPVFE